MIATIIVEKSHSGNYHASNFHSGYYHNSDYHSGKLPLATIIRSGNSHSVDVEEHVGSLETDTTFPLNSFKIVLTVRIQFTQHHHHQIAQHHHQKSDDDDDDHHMKSVQWPQKTGCRKNLLRNLERGGRRKIFYFKKPWEANTQIFLISSLFLNLSLFVFPFVFM